MSLDCTRPRRAAAMKAEKVVKFFQKNEQEEDADDDVEGSASAENDSETKSKRKRSRSPLQEEEKDANSDEEYQEPSAKSKDRGSRSNGTRNLTHLHKKRRMLPAPDLPTVAPIAQRVAPIALQLVFDCLAVKERYTSVRLTCKAWAHANARSNMIISQPVNLVHSHNLNELMKSPAWTQLRYLRVSKKNCKNRYGCVDKDKPAGSMLMTRIASQGAHLHRLDVSATLKASIPTKMFPIGLLRLHAEIFILLPKKYADLTTRSYWDVAREIADKITCCKLLRHLKLYLDIPYVCEDASHLDKGILSEEWMSLSNLVSASIVLIRCGWKTIRLPNIDIDCLANHPSITALDLENANGNGCMVERLASHENARKRLQYLPQFHDENNQQHIFRTASKFSALRRLCLASYVPYDPDVPFIQEGDKSNYYNSCKYLLTDRDWEDVKDNLKNVTEVQLMGSNEDESLAMINHIAQHCSVRDVIYEGMYSPTVMSTVPVKFPHLHSLLLVSNDDVPQKQKNAAMEQLMQHLPATPIKCLNIGEFFLPLRFIADYFPRFESLEMLFLSGDAFQRRLDIIHVKFINSLLPQSCKLIIDGKILGDRNAESSIYINSTTYDDSDSSSDNDD